MPTPKPRMREELYINLNPLQRGGITPPEARKTALTYVDGYSTCDYCLGTIHLIKNPPISDFLEELAELLGMDCAILTHSCREVKQFIMHAITKPVRRVFR